MEIMAGDTTNNILFRDQWVEYIHGLQNNICDALELADGKTTFKEEIWEREAGTGGGGITRVMANGNVFEKGGVNTSVVYGDVSDNMKQQLGMNGSQWFAAGLSLVIHPFNPFVPTVHANWRYFELYDEAGIIKDRWFGGGSDLTPYYLFEADAIHFHKTIKNAIDPFGANLYTAYKKQCDEYFVNKHRNNEARGIGGVFYDHLKPENDTAVNRLFSFQQANGNAFTAAYLPIVEKRKNLAFTSQQKHWQ